MKKLNLLLIALLFSSIISSQDIQSIKMGDPIEKVKILHDKTVNRSGEKYSNMFSNIDYCGLKTSVIFYFNNDTLWGTRQFIREEHDNLDDYLADYKKVDEFLNSKYEKIETREFWDDETYKDDPTKLSLALSLDHYNISTTYKDGDITIIHIIKKSPNPVPVIYQIVDYSTQKLLDEEKLFPPKAKDILRRTK